MHGFVREFSRRILNVEPFSIDQINIHQWFRLLTIPGRLNGCFDAVPVTSIRIAVVRFTGRH